MWKWKKRPPQKETHPLYGVCYWHIGTDDGWIRCKTHEEQIEYLICCEILKRMGYIEWQK